jgi:hypothetical protein
MTAPAVNTAPLPLRKRACHRVSSDSRGSGSHGDREIDIMQTIEQSGWKGPVGVLVLLVLWKPADTEIVLKAR